MQKTIFQLERLTCPSCINKIETVLNEHIGVEEVYVFFNSSKVKVGFDPSKVEINQLESVIKSIGFAVVS
ncbi:heavy-metal-associated domain-containing protein [Amphibacillus xylanus]|uniref:Putative metal-binding protein n=1 Tax=Amphibacillus xylanus (strain ATCC 51415 / DSM 6626 / JCM 7361 / LMG 17667 / NBRC 15112 / Ep01) TaxID=698758 RepID=K0J4Q5_AMPXN|nr:heavy-metal-associated domain-containing protein [Amphibacillus xylanus]BAM48327.1 putative metal-binding protein [Amphibacillus xylanus NBRC 15112]